jgi:hypothetical protein
MVYEMDYFLSEEIRCKHLKITVELGTGKIIKSIISRTLNFDVNCRHLHESCNLELNKLMLKIVYFDCLTENRLSLIIVIIFQLFSRNRPKMRFLLIIDKGLAYKENSLKF